MLPLLQEFGPRCRSSVNFFDQGVELSPASVQLGEVLLGAIFPVVFLGDFGVFLAVLMESRLLDESRPGPSMELLEGCLRSVSGGF